MPGLRCSVLKLHLLPCRSFSELYRLSLQEPSRRGAPEPVQDEAPGVALTPTTRQLLHVCLNDGSSPPGPGDLAEERTEFLHSQNSPSPCRCSLQATPLIPPWEDGWTGLCEQGPWGAASSAELSLLSPAPYQMRPQSCPTPPQTSSWSPRPSRQHLVLAGRHRLPR